MNITIKSYAPNEDTFYAEIDNVQMRVTLQGNDDASAVVVHEIKDNDGNIVESFDPEELSAIARECLAYYESFYDRDDDLSDE